MEAAVQEQVKLWDAVPGFDFESDMDLKETGSWFFDGTHSVPLLTPLYDWFWLRYCSYGSFYASETLSIPRSKGFSMRRWEGGSYIGMRIVRDEAEVEKRTAVFKEALAPWVEDFDAIWGAQKDELIGLYGKLRSLDLDKASTIDLMHHLWDMIATARRMWEIHFQGMYVSYAAFMITEDMVKPYGLTVESPEFQNMFRGFDNKVFQVDRRLWELANSAVEKGLSATIMEGPIDTVIDRLSQGDGAGQGWLKELRDFLEVDGWRMVRMMDLNEPYWYEDPTSVILPIRAFIKKGGDFDLDSVRVKLAGQREKSIAALMEKAPAEERASLEALIRLGGKASSYSEEHDLFCELGLHAVLRRGFLGIGRRFVAKGVLDRAEDIFFLGPDEIERALQAADYVKLQKIAGRRRDRWEDLNSRWEEVRGTVIPPAFTVRASFEEAVGMDLIPSGDPIIIKIVVGELPRVRPELKANLYGVCGSPGVAEGPARVIMTYTELDQVQKGDILICPGTNPAWTPVFGLVGAVVADRGGTLTHTAIVGREYGIPVLVNTFTGTSVIKTGQRVRVDATEGALYVL